MTNEEEVMEDQTIDFLLEVLYDGIDADCHDSTYNRLAYPTNDEDMLKQMMLGAGLGTIGLISALT